MHHHQCSKPVSQYGIFFLLLNRVKELLMESKLGDIDQIYVYIVRVCVVTVRNYEA